VLKRAAYGRDDGIDAVSGVERIPCPIDPSHTIYKHDLSQHLKICNIRTREAEMLKSPYYCLDCNARGSAVSASASADRGDADADIDVDALVKKIDFCYQTIVRSEILDDECGDGSSHDGNGHPDEVDGITATVVQAVAGAQTAFARTRHAKQDAVLSITLTDTFSSQNSDLFYIFYAVSSEKNGCVWIDCCKLRRSKL